MPVSSSGSDAAASVPSAAGPAPALNLRAGLATALSVIAAVLIAIAAGFDDPWWAAISAWMVANPDRSAMWSKGAMRITGTIAGCFFGYWTVALAGEVTPVLLVAMAGVGALSNERRFSSRFGYAWILFGITYLMVIFAQLGNSNDIFHFTLARAAEIITGVLTAMVAGFVVAPRVTAASGGAPRPAPEFTSGPMALIGGIMPLVVAFGWALFDIPSIQQVMVSSLAVLDRDVGTVHMRIAQRLGGCVLGAAIGLSMILIGVDDFPMWLAVFGGGLFVLSGLHQGGGRYAYVGTQGGIALIMTMVTGRGPPAVILPIIDRLGGMVFGVLLIVVVSHVVSLKIAAARRHAAASSDGTTAG